jgi:hypothetical protein
MARAYLLEELKPDLDSNRWEMVKKRKQLQKD